MNLFNAFAKSIVALASILFPLTDIYTLVRRLGSALDKK